MSTEASATSSGEPYVPPKVWKYENSDGSKMTMNRPTAGSRFEKELSVGSHPIQLYSLGTPNGQKITVMLEELLAAGHKDAEYDAWIIKIFESDQFGSGFVDINPNSKIPAMQIRYPDEPTVDLFESGSILLHLAERFGKFLPSSHRPQVLNWLFWQMGSAPYVGGGFGHFFAYANEKQKYPIDRFTMETKRQLHVLELQLSKHTYVAGTDDLTIADIAIFPWYGSIVLGGLYKGSAEFLDVENDYPNVIRWAKALMERPAFQRGMRVNAPWLPNGVAERHAASDLDIKTEQGKGEQ